MSPASHAVNRLRRMYRLVLLRMRQLNSRLIVPSRSTHAGGLPAAEAFMVLRDVW